MSIELGQAVVKSDLVSQAVVMLHDFEALTQRERLMYSILPHHRGTLGMLQVFMYRLTSGKTRVKMVMSQEMFDLAFLASYGYKL